MNKYQGFLLRIKRAVPIAWTSGTNGIIFTLYARYKKETKNDKGRNYG